MESWVVSWHSKYFWQWVCCRWPSQTQITILSNQERRKKSAWVFNPSAEKTFLSYNKISASPHSLLCPTLSAALTVESWWKGQPVQSNDSTGSQLEKRNSIKTKSSMHQSPLFVNHPFLTPIHLLKCTPRLLLAFSPITVPSSSLEPSHFQPLINSSSLLLYRNLVLPAAMTFPLLQVTSLPCSAWESGEMVVDSLAPCQPQEPEAFHFMAKHPFTPSLKSACCHRNWLPGLPVVMQTTQYLN